MPDILFSLRDKARVVVCDIDLAEWGAVAESQANWNTYLFHMLILSVILESVQPITVSKVNDVLACWRSRTCQESRDEIPTNRGTSSVHPPPTPARLLPANLFLLLLQHKRFPAHRPLPDSNGLLPCAFQQPRASFSGLCCANYHQVWEPSWLGSEAILEPVFVMSHRPTGWQQRGLCPAVGSFARGNLQDQGQGNNVKKDSLLLNRCGVLRLCAWLLCKR